jgi:predicted SprT family Zn-dependent metalloprotease
MHAQHETPTTVNARTLQRAYDYFNCELFAEQLPQALITLQRHPKCRGYFHAAQMRNRNENLNVDEIALNPDTFAARSDSEILSTLAHEMVHQWQHHHGTPPRKAYHDRQWAQKMIEIGLQPSADGQPGGKITGAKITHYIIPSGPFAEAVEKLIRRGFALHWQATPAPPEEKKAKKASKTRYTCPACSANAWAKPDTKLICGSCFDEDDPQIMTAEEPEPEK